MAQNELKVLSDETGMFNSITDEDIEAGKGKTYSDYKAMRDPMAGLLSLPGSGFTEEDE